MQKYQLLQTLGKCPQDNSILCLAKQKQLQKYYMFKKIALFNSNQSQQLILNQAKMLKQLNHPHILKYYDILLDKDDLIEILQFCQYGSISNYLQKKKNRNQTLSEKLIISWVMQILMALEYLNQKHIVHRLITTDNIYLNYQGDLKIGSFGKAKQLESTLEKAQTIIGEPCNLSPQMVQGSQYDLKTDIWSLGCLIYQLSTFQAPFKYGNLLKLYDSIVQQPCPQLPVKYSKYLAPLYRKMMKKNPSTRPSASQLLEEQVFAQLMKQYLKKKKIDSIDLKKMEPKPLVVQMKINMQKKVNKIQLQPISSSRVSVKSPASKQKQSSLINISTSSTKNKSKQKSSKKSEQSNILTAKKKSSKIEKIGQNQFIQQNDKNISSPPLPKSKQKLQKQQIKKRQQKQKQNCKKQQKQQQFQKQQNKQNTDNNKDNKKQSIQQLQTEYIALLYKIKLQKLQQKYSPNMSKIFQRTQDFQSFKQLLKQEC